MHINNTGFDVNQGFMPDKNIQLLFQQVEDAMKAMQLKEGDMLSFSDEHRRMHVSPYRMTLEIRFPEGIEQLNK